MPRIVMAALALAALVCTDGCAARRTLERSAPFVHVVLFKTRAGGPEAAAGIVRDIRTMLEPLPTVRGLWIGRPAPTNDRPIVDVNYDVGLMILFEDQKGLQEYLDHPVHAEFARKHDTRCDVRVFDIVR